MRTCKLLISLLHENSWRRKTRSRTDSAKIPVKQPSVGSIPGRTSARILPRYLPLLLPLPLRVRQTSFFISRLPKNIRRGVTFSNPRRRQCAALIESSNVKAFDVFCLDLLLFLSLPLSLVIPSSLLSQPFSLSLSLYSILSFQSIALLLTEIQPRITILSKILLGNSRDATVRVNCFDMSKTARSIPIFIA